MWCGPLGAIYPTLRTAGLNIGHAECNWLQVNLLLALAHCYPGLSFSAILLRWHDVSTRTLQTCALLNNINSSIARSKMSDVAIMAMDE